MAIGEHGLQPCSKMGSCGNHQSSNVVVYSTVFTASMALTGTPLLFNILLLIEKCISYMCWSEWIWLRLHLCGIHSWRTRLFPARLRFPVIVSFTNRCLRPEMPSGGNSRVRIHDHKQNSIRADEISAESASVTHHHAVRDNPPGRLVVAPQTRVLHLICVQVVRHVDWPLYSPPQAR